MIILAAGQGTRLHPLTIDRPKCLVELHGKSLLDWQLKTAHFVGIEDVVVVGGYHAEQLYRSGIQVVINHNFAHTNMVTSLFKAEAYFGDAFIVSYGDIVYSPKVLKMLLKDGNPIGVMVDRQWRSYWEMRFNDPLNDAESLAVDDRDHIISIGQRETNISEIQGQYMGLIIFRNEGVDALKFTYQKAREDERTNRLPFGGTRSLELMFLTDLLQGMVKLGIPAKAVFTDGGWVEIDNLEDLKVAEALFLQGHLD